MTNRLRLLQTLSAAALLAAIAGQSTLSASAQESASTPLAGVPEETTNYPSGDRLRSEYRAVNKDLNVRSATAESLGPAASLAAASAIQSGLPAGFTLQSGYTVHVAEAAAPGTGVTLETAGAGASDKYIAVYPLAYKGVPLAKGSDYMAMMSGDGTLLVTRQRGLPEAVDGADPSVTVEAAVAKAIDDAKDAFGATPPKASEPTLEIWVDSANQGRLAWTFALAGDSVAEPQVRQYWVAAIGEPSVLNWESDVYHTHQGTVTGTLWATSPLKPTASRPLPEIQVRRASDGLTKVTGDDGRYGFDSGAGNTAISAVLDGPNVDVQNQAGPDMTQSKNGTPANPIDLNFGAATEFERAQVSAFYWADKAHALASGILAPADLANLVTRTSINATCNAYWNGSSINFFRAGGSCPNTAYSDVVLHEYGHGVDARKGGILDGGYSEGFGDAMALLGTRQPCLGRDFLGAGTCLRPATDIILWPPAPGTGVHDVGRRYAGFTWELIQQLTKTSGDIGAYDIAGRLILAAAAANPSNIPDAVYLSFLADDNDGNLVNGSPHFMELAAAADSRHIPRPPNPTVAIAGGIGVSGQFPWTPQKTVSTNDNILQVSLHLDQPSVVHVSANSSAQSTTPINFRTGFYNQANPNVVWTYSYRDVSLPSVNQWANFGSKFAIQLPAGNHTLYWKIWVAGGTLKLSSGTLQVETFNSSGAPLAIASEGGTTDSDLNLLEPSAGPAPAVDATTDEMGEPITTIQGQ